MSTFAHKHKGPKEISLASMEDEEGWHVIDRFPLNIAPYFQPNILIVSVIRLENRLPSLLLLL